MKRVCEKSLYCRIIKRVLDLSLSAALLSFLIFPMLIIAVTIRCDSRGGAIFRQKRIGREGRIFFCYKFRTMYINTPREMPARALREREKYVTRIGGFLRKTSLDELPQLFNVLKGDMSLIGPRPLVCTEADMHRQRMAKGVYRLRPGITGMAQINGRNALCDEEKLKEDVFYLENVRIMLDLKILLKTVIKVIRRESIDAEPRIEQELK